MKFNTQVHNISCRARGGSLDLEFIGGIAPYTYLLKEKENTICKKRPMFDHASVDIIPDFVKLTVASSTFVSKRNIQLNKFIPAPADLILYANVCNFTCHTDH